MAAFRYRARSLSGEAQTGLLEAPDLDQAVERIHSMGLVPVRLEAYGAPRTRARTLPFLDRKVTPRDLILFTRQLETMLDSGLPILSSLESLHSQTTHPKLKQAIDRVRSDVEQGSTLTEALRRQPECFPRIYVNLVFAGEEGGLLAQMLDRVASLLEYEAETDQRIRSATFYPTLIVSELVGYKRNHLAIEACNQLRVPLVVIGGGPLLGPLCRLAGPTVQMLGWQSDDVRFTGIVGTPFPTLVPNATHCAAHAGTDGTAPAAGNPPTAAGQPAPEANDTRMRSCSPCSPGVVSTSSAMRSSTFPTPAL